MKAKRIIHDSNLEALTASGDRILDQHLFDESTMQGACPSGWRVGLFAEIAFLKASEEM